MNPYLVYLTFILVTINMKSTLELTIEQFELSIEDYKYFNDFEFSEREIEQYVIKYEIEKLEKLSSAYFVTYKVKPNLFILWDRAYNTLELFKQKERLEEEVTELIRKGNLEYDDDIIPYSLNFFNSTLLQNQEVVASILCQNMMLTKNKLNYDLESLKELDIIIENNQIDSEYIKENLLWLSLYIGFVYIKENNGNWQTNDFENNLKLPVIISTKGKEINIMMKVYNSLTEQHGSIILPSRIYANLDNNIFRW